MAASNWRLFIGNSLIFFVLIFAVKSDNECSVENTLRALFSPDESPSIQLQALRQDVIRRLQEALGKQKQEADGVWDYKRSISSLARWDNLPLKRNLEALARAGYIRTQPEDDENDSNFKRSIANLAKNGQLPEGMTTFQNENDKRGIESLARNGELHRKREMQELLEELYDKRNIGSLARNYNFPSYGKRFIGSLARNGDLARFNDDDKRNIASLVRDGGKLTGKRNVAALLRRDSYLNNVGKQLTGEDDGHTETPDAEKRNLASIKAQYKQKFKRSTGDGKSDSSTRNKREIDYYESVNDEYPSPVYQNQNIYDYEDFINALNSAYPNAEKRFLGSIAKTGWYRSPSSYRYPAYEKRHIGSLARLGWLPTMRSVRRFNRSGRSAIYEDSSCRSSSSDGGAENDTGTETTFPLEDKRFLLQPAVDQILLRKILMQPRSH